MGKNCHLTEELSVLNLLSLCKPLNCMHFLPLLPCAHLYFEMEKKKTLSYYNKDIIRVLACPLNCDEIFIFKVRFFKIP